MMTPAKPKKSRKIPPSVRVYVKDEKFVQELEQDAEHYGLSVSQLCVMALNIGLPEVKRHLDQIVQEGV